MVTQKCIACDGYGTRPHRLKPTKFTRCKPCGGRGVVSVFAAAPPVQPVPFVPTVNPPWIIPFVDPVRPPDIYPQPDVFPKIICGGTSIFNPGLRYTAQQS